MTCFHCGVDIPAGQLVTGERGGETLAFCCRGCLGAWLLITGAGLDDFYRRREWGEPGVGAAAFRADFEDTALARHVYESGGKSGIDIIIDGIRCASCVWLNEKIIAQLPGVVDVRVNYATNRARVLFEPDTTTPSAIFTRIAGIGYLPRPFTRSAAEEQAQRERKDLLIRFGTAFFLTMQLMAYSFALYAGYFQGIGSEIKLMMQLFSLLVTTPVIFYAGWPFLRGGWRGLVNRAPSMDLLIAVGALSSYGYSIYATIAGGEVYYETAAMIVTLILAGRLLENGAKRRAAAGVEGLLALTAGEAQRITPDGIEPVAAEELRTDDLVLVGPGERFPVDGRIAEGATDADESPATGEALPVVKNVGDRVVAGSINLTCAVRIVCECPVADSFVARMARLVEEAQSRRAPIQGVADRAAAWFVPAVLLLAVATFAWQVAQQQTTGAALMTALAVVVIACPCALGLATPTAILAGTGAAAAAGVIFKGGDILERLSRSTVAVFDKTGTVTRGEPEVTAVCPAPGESRDGIVALAAGVECASRHPLARAVRAHAQRSGIAANLGTELLTVPGGGVAGQLNGEPVMVGSPRFLSGLGISGIPGEIAASTGETVACVARSGRYAGAIVFRDSLREDIPALIGHLRERRIRCILLSGDRREVAGFIADKIGIDEWQGEMAPEEKAAFIERLRAEGETVLMVGDGINDAPALSLADVGCALAGGTDIALETSDLVLVKPEPARLIFACRTARRTMAVIRQNLGWAFVYNIVGIPLAMTGRLTPIYAAAAMALSSLCVVGNSLRLLRLKNG
jgi:Cu2+-exporting ATPase